MAIQPLEQYRRYCPGEEHIRISDSICFGRRRASYPKCGGCQFNDDEKVAARRQRIVAPGVVVRGEDSGACERAFGPWDVRGTSPGELDEEVAWRVGFGAGSYLKPTLRGIDLADPEMGRVVVGRDNRGTSPALSGALIDGIRSSGAGVIDIGVVDAGQWVFAVNRFKCCGGVHTTAGHQPAAINGFRICSQGGKPVGKDTGLNDIRMIARNTNRHETPDLPELHAADLSGAYREFILRQLQPLPRALRVVVDAGFGTAAAWIPRLFGGVERLTLDALNFGDTVRDDHPPDPAHPGHLKVLGARVRRIRADVGLGFDADAGRLVVVDDQGRPIPGDLLTAVLARYFLTRIPNATIVYDLCSSRVVAESIRKAGGQPYRSRVGPAQMAKALAENRAWFGGECSGQYYFKDTWQCESGFVAAVHVLNLVAQSTTGLSRMITPLRKYHRSGAHNFACPDPGAVIRHLGAAYADGRQDFLDGLTVQYPAWWFNIRRSNTSALLRLNLEANTAELLEEQRRAVTETLRAVIQSQQDTRGTQA